MWVAYPLESKHMGSLSRPNDWDYNPEIDEQYQVNLNSSYAGSTYSRGHLILHQLGATGTDPLQRWCVEQPRASSTVDRPERDGICDYGRGLREGGRIEGRIVHKVEQRHQECAYSKLLLQGSIEG